MLERYDPIIHAAEQLAADPDTSALAAARAYKLVHDLYARQARYPKAIEAYSKYLDKLSESKGRALAARVVRTRVERCILHLKYDEAREKAEAYLKKFSDNPKDAATALALLARVTWRQKSYEEASEFADMVVKGEFTS